MNESRQFSFIYEQHLAKSYFINFVELIILFLSAVLLSSTQLPRLPPTLHNGTLLNYNDYTHGSLWAGGCCMEAKFGLFKFVLLRQTPP
jgi:hypothetical protein